MFSQWHTNQRAGDKMKADGMFEADERGKWAIVYAGQLKGRDGQPLYASQAAAEEDARRLGWLPDAYIMQI